MDEELQDKEETLKLECDAIPLENRKQISVIRENLIKNSTRSRSNGNRHTLQQSLEDPV